MPMCNALRSLVTPIDRGRNAAKGEIRQRCTARHRITFFVVRLCPSSVTPRSVHPCCIEKILTLKKRTTCSQYVICAEGPLCFSPSRPSGFLFLTDTHVFFQQVEPGHFFSNFHTLDNTICFRYILVTLEYCDILHA